MKVAVIVGRFQAHYLHEGHQTLMNAAAEDCDKVIVFIGTSIVRSVRNPLSFDMRKFQVKTLYGSFEVHELKDEKTDEQWLESLFSKIEDLTEEGDEIVYYGSRDSFLSTLPEGSNIVNIEQKFGVSATNLRGSIQNRNSRWFLEGYVKAIIDEFPAHYTVVDAIITNGTHVLLGKKKSGWCLIGGFADAEDFNLEAAILRETEEEVGLKLENPKYLMSHQCNDWRYHGARQPFTSVFILQTDLDTLKSAVPGDDIGAVIVARLDRVGEYLLETDSHYMYIQKYLECQQ